MRSFRISLGKKLVFSGVLFVLVPILVVGIFSVDHASKALEESARRELLLVSKSIAKVIEVTLTEKLVMVQQLAGDSAVVSGANAIAQGGDAGSSKEVQMLVDKLTATMKWLGDGYEGIFLLDTRGVIRADGVGGSLVGLDVSDRAYFKGSKEGKANIGAVVYSKKINEPVVHVAAPITSQSGKFLGAMVVSVKMASLSREIVSSDLGKTGYAFLSNGDGLTLAHKDKENILKTNIGNVHGMERIAARMAGRETGIENYSYKGIDKTVAFAPVDVTGWSVGATQSADEFLLPAHTIRNMTFAAAAVLTALSLMIVVLFSRRISRPIFQVVSGLGESAMQISAAAEQIASGSQQLAEGASHQAASMEETSSFLEEMASMTRQNAENSSQANQLMKQAGEVVSRANGSMKMLTCSMGEISKASEDTQRIVKTIDEIAFQTNLLALNAAVEAARAGEAGAGFAVVADEVRNLAMKAAEAAKNTAGLIEDTVRKVQDGSKLVGMTNQEFTTVSEIVGKSGYLAGEIAAASQEQAQGIEQISRAISEMEQVIQNNSANAEESASASEEMNAQAERQKEFIAGLVALVGANGNGGQGRSRRRGEERGEDHEAMLLQEQVKAELPFLGHNERTQGKRENYR
jgi:methyl-accepting chemotaxis protein